MKLNYLAILCVRLRRVKSVYVKYTRIFPSLSALKIAQIFQFQDTGSRDNVLTVRQRISLKYLIFRIMNTLMNYLTGKLRIITGKLWEQAGGWVC
jgi:hypothetical protein